MSALPRVCHCLAVLGLLLTACQPVGAVAPTVSVPTHPVQPTPQPEAEATAAPAATLTAVPTPVTGPRLTVSPPPSQVVANRWPETRLTFARAMDLASVEAALTVEPEVSLELRWVGMDLFVKPAEPLAFNQAYAFTLGQSAMDAHGLALEKTYRWRYHLLKLVANIFYPTQNDRGRPVGVRFNYALEAASLRAAFRLVPEATGELAVSDDGLALTFTPAVSLTQNSTYTITFVGELQATDGLPVPLPEPVSFQTPPPLVAYSPNGNSYTGPTSPISLSFDRLMDPASTEAAVSFEPAIAGQFAWNGATLTFTPDEYLAERTRYTVTMGQGALAADGTPLATEPFRWTFMTDELRDVASFGMGPNAQVVDANGRRALQFAYLQASAPSLTFELYALTTEQFLDRYATGFHSDPYNEAPAFSTDATTLARAWELSDAPTYKSDYSNLLSEVVIPADVAPGLYVLNLNAGRLNDQLLVVLSQNVVVVKQDEAQLAAWVTGMQGQPAPGARVSVYARDGRLLLQGQADDHGFFRAALAAEAAPHLVIAADGEDLTVAGLSADWLGGAFVGSGTAGSDFVAYLYTDRPVYRPGQIVSFKAIVRRDDDASLSMPAAGTSVTVRVRDARSNVAQTLTLATTHFGTLHGQFTLAAGAMLGNYTLEVEVEGTRHRQIFKVQDYRKPDYTVTVRANAAHYVVGDEMRVTVDTRYFFGEPVPNARLLLRQYELGVYYDCWEVCANNGEQWYDSGVEVIHGQADANGRYTFSVPAQYGQLAQYGWDHSRPSRWALEVTVDDGSHQVVSGFAPVQVYPAAEAIELSVGRRLLAPGQAFAVTAQARGLDGAPAVARTLRLELRRYSSVTYDYTEVAQSLTLVTGADGQASASLTVPQAGYYQARLTGRDSRGNVLEAETWLSVYEEGAVWTSQLNTALTVTADQASYAPGDTATLLVTTGLSGPALLSVERGSLRRTQMVQLQAPLTRLAVPIEAGDAPNIIVTVQAWQLQDTSLAAYANEYYYYNTVPDARLASAGVELNVPVTGKRLTVALTADQPSYLPGEAAAFTVRVTNERGEPVSAEVSLALVDEAIFSLSEELSGPMFGAFYFRRANQVRTYESTALERQLTYCCDRGGGGGDGLGPGSPRGDFPDTAAWIPVLHTDWKGEAVVTLELPDNLTTWRLTVKAATADTQVGEAQATFVTQQPISLRPLLPRSLTAGDVVLLSAMVRNDSDHAQDLLVTLMADQLQLSVPATQTVRLQPGQQRLVGWPATATEAGTTSVLVRAVPVSAPQSGVGDAIQLPLTIQPLAVPTVTTQAGDFTGTLNTTLDVPAGALPMSLVRLELSRSIAGTLLSGLEYLTGFPYGCVEQTMSRALPNAVVGRALHQLGVSNPTLENQLPPMIQASIQRLYGFQHNDGGWGWWHDDATDDYQTAWVVFGLAQTAEAGYPVDAGVIRRGVEWLAYNLDGMDPRTRAFALYSMAAAGYGDLGESLALAGEADKLDPFSRAGLALALHRLGANTPARQLVDGLADSAVVQDGKVFWPNANEDGHYYQKTMASTTRSTALVLSAFVKIRPGHALEGGIVRFLMSMRGHTGWGSTNETSFAILGLTDHLLAHQAAGSETGYRVELNGQVVASGTLGQGAPAVSLEIPATALASGPNALRLVHMGSGRLYYVVSSRVYVAQAAIRPAGNVTVKREYLDPNTGRPITAAVAAGDLVKVRVRVNFPAPAFYVLVEDHLPGGLEALNEGLNTTSHEGTAYDWEAPVFYWREYGYNNKEVFGDRVSFFITEVQRGQHEYTYYARAVRSGTFVALPAEAYAMYDLSVWGRSGSAVLAVEE